MIPAEIIKQKRDGKMIARDDLKAFVEGYTLGTIPEAQMSALFMAIYFSGMEDEEIFSLVNLMLESGKQMDFSHMDAYVADKHSTGGVGDKVSIILGPLMAAAGLAIPMISGRSLGHTGGTLDKLETIPGYRTDLSLQEFQRQVEIVGIAMIGQTGEICPADKKMYALRDVTGTVESIPLICGSIMSKKIAEGIRGLVLDVKTGSGAFMKSLEEAKALGEMLKRIGKAFNVQTDVIYSSMNQPLGKTAGLWCEVAESIEAMHGNGPDDLMAVTFELGGKLLVQAGITRSETAALSIQQDLIDSGKAWNKFLEMTEAQGGNIKDLDQYNKLHQPAREGIYNASGSGIIQSIDTYHIGLATVELGCGRKNRKDGLDPTAGMEFLKKIGDPVVAGEPLIRCFNSNQKKLEIALNYLHDTFKIGKESITHTLFFD